MDTESDKVVVVGIETHSTYEGYDWHSAGHEELERLFRATKPVPGKDGTRIDINGKQWYSTAWLGRNLES